TSASGHEPGRPRARDEPMSEEEGLAIESRHELLQRMAEGDLAGRTLRDLAGESLALVGADLDGNRLERDDRRGYDLSRARLDTSTLVSVDLRRALWHGALWHRVHASHCDLTEIDLTAATLLRCEIGPVRMPRALMRGAALRGTRFLTAELYGADLSGAVLTRCPFTGYGDGIASLSSAILASAVLREVVRDREHIYAHC